LKNFKIRMQRVDYIATNYYKPFSRQLNFKVTEVLKFVFDYQINYHSISKFCETSTAIF